MNDKSADCVCVLITTFKRETVNGANMSSLLDRARAAAAAAGMLAVNNVTIEPVVMLYFTAWISSSPCTRGECVCTVIRP